VSFFGFGGHRRGSVGFKSVGWLPIGPGDLFYPWYGRNETQLKGVDEINPTRLTRVVAPLRDDNEFSNLSLAIVDERIRQAISMLPADGFGTGRSAPGTVGRRAFRDGRIITGNLPIVPTKEMLVATNRPAKPSMSSGAPQEQYFTKRQPAAAQSFDKEAAQVRESIEESGQLVPVREVTKLDSADTARHKVLENGSERAAEPIKDAQSEQKPKSKPEAGVRAVSSPEKSRHSTRASAPTAAAAKTKPAGRGAKTNVASRHLQTAASLKVPAAKSTHRTTTVAAASRGAQTHTAQSYVDSANRQMDKGNYTAAIANYKRALQVDGNSSAAKVSLERARRAMHAENEILSSRR
jgi:hypothetical protein